jgi:hypothetical protein
MGAKAGQAKRTALDAVLESEPAHTYTTSEGRVLTLRVVSPLLMQRVIAGIREEYVARGEPLEVPTYTVPIAGGGEQPFRTK